MNHQEPTQAQNLAANELTEKLIKSGLDDFDISIAQCIDSLVKQVRQHRGVSIKAAKKILTDFLEVKK